MNDPFKTKSKPYFFVKLRKVNVNELFDAKTRKSKEEFKIPVGAIATTRPFVVWSRFDNVSVDVEKCTFKKKKQMKIKKPKDELIEFIIFCFDDFNSQSKSAAVILKQVLLFCFFFLKKTN